MSLFIVSMLLDRYINYITFTVRNCMRFFHEGESEGGKTKGNDAGIPITCLPRIQEVEMRVRTEPCTSES